MRSRLSPDFTQLPFHPFQTGADRQAVQVSAGRMSGPPGQPAPTTAPMTAGMSVPQSIGSPMERNAMGLNQRQMNQASYDPTSDQEMQKTMRARAAALRDDPTPQGRTVGPLNVYVGPNWGETVGHVGKKLLGGYLDKKANEAQEEIGRKSGLAKAAEAEASVFKAGKEQEDTDWEKQFKERQQEEVERAAAANEKADLQGLALDAIEMEPIQYLRDDGSKLYVGYRLNKDDTAVEPYNLDTGKKVNMGDLTIDPDQLGGDAKSFNEPIRFVDAKTGDERMLSWNKGGYYIDAMDQKQVAPEDLKGWIPEAAMSEKQREDQITSWVQNNGPTLELLHDIQQANAAFAAAGGEGGPSGVFNYATKMKGTAGDIFRAIDDVGEEGNPTADAYAAANTVFNAISRMRAGLSQTVNEVQRIEQETGQPLAVSPEVLAKYWGRLQNKVIEDLRRAEETMSPRTMMALSRWRTEKANKNLSSGLIPEEEEQAAKKPATMSQEKWDRLQELRRKRVEGTL
jgi:hypothetical protein